MSDKIEDLTDLLHKTRFSFITLGDSIVQNKFSLTQLHPLLKEDFNWTKVMLRPNVIDYFYANEKDLFLDYLNGDLLNTDYYNFYHSHMIFLLTKILKDLKLTHNKKTTVKMLKVCTIAILAQSLEMTTKQATSTYNLLCDLDPSTFNKEAQNLLSRCFRRLTVCKNIKTPIRKTLLENGFAELEYVYPKLPLSSYELDLICQNQFPGKRQLVVNTFPQNQSYTTTTTQNKRSFDLLIEYNLNKSQLKHLHQNANFSLNRVYGWHKNLSKESIKYLSTVLNSSSLARVLTRSQIKNKLSFKDLLEIYIHHHKSWVSLAHSNALEMSVPKADKLVLNAITSNKLWQLELKKHNLKFINLDENINSNTAHQIIKSIYNKTPSQNNKTIMLIS